ncbi:disulfide oxidoreductase [Cohnella hongkongensis]|uniref:Disulfide oxidoreductase n=1 Tax=Cohnella hongkongensis TaxID=178337 RepID=A0ABV9F957_9BACL
MNNGSEVSTIRKPMSSSSWLFVAWAVSVTATAGSLYLSEYLHFTPCSLCWYQRIFMYPLTIVLGVASWRGRKPLVPAGALPLTAIGGAFSVYHIAVQELPHGESGPFCGPTSCAEDVLNAFGFITVPMLALTAFALIFVSLLLARRSDNESKEGMP